MVVTSLRKDKQGNWLPNNGWLSWEDRKALMVVLNQKSRNLL